MHNFRLFTNPISTLSTKIEWLQHFLNNIVFPELKCWSKMEHLSNFCGYYQLFVHPTLHSRRAGRFLYIHIIFDFSTNHFSPHFFLSTRTHRSTLSQSHHLRTQHINSKCRAASGGRGRRRIDVFTVQFRRWSQQRRRPVAVVAARPRRKGPGKSERWNRTRAPSLGHCG